MAHPALAEHSAAELEAILQNLFGAQAHITPLASPELMGRRIHGVDLKKTAVAGASRIYGDVT
jgi:hypothetical protein